MAAERSTRLFAATAAVFTVLVVPSTVGFMSAQILG